MDPTWATEPTSSSFFFFGGGGGDYNKDYKPYGAFHFIKTHKFSLICE